MNKITLLYNNNIYVIEKESYETINETYIRGWYIVKNYDKIDYLLLNTYSIMGVNTLIHNMNYDEPILPLLK